MSKSGRIALGFTLIELLVVIAIVAVFISFLMPALSAAKVEGHKSRCLANLREISKTSILYAHDDPGDILGPVHRESKNFIREGYAHYGGGPGDMPYQAWDDPFDPRTRPFNWIIYGGINNIVKNSVPGDRRVFQIFQCTGDDFGWQEWPNMPTHPQETERSYFYSNGTSYRMNNLPDDRSQFRQLEYGQTPEPPLSIGIYGRPTTQIQLPSKVISFMEARAYQTIWTNDVWGELEAGELTGAHMKLGFFNLSFVDGHADYSDMGNGTFFPKNPRFDDMDVRGTWGHMDVFPAEPIPEP